MVFKVSYVIKYIWFGGTVKLVRDKEIEFMKTLVIENMNYELSTIPFFYLQKARVVYEPFFHKS